MRGALRRTRLAVTLGLALAVPRAFALNPALEISQYAHASWKISDGFPRGMVNAIAQTPDGYLWLGTEFGLVRFDGVRHVEWTPPAGERLPSDEIRNLLVSRDGTLWIGTRRGLASWKDGRLTRYAELAEQAIAGLLEDREGTVWAGGLGLSTGRLCAIRTGSVRCYGEDGRFGAGVLSLYEYSGDMWAGSFTGLWRWKPDPPRLYSVPGRPNPTINDLIEGDNGVFWIATPEGIRQFVNGKFEARPPPAGGQFYPRSLLRDRDGSLWIGTMDQGLRHVHQGKVDVFTSADGLSSDDVHRVFEDREGNIWASTSEGFDRFHDFAVSTMSFKQGLASPTALSVLAAKDGAVWLGTIDGLTRWKSGQFTIYRKSATRQPERRTQRSAVREITDGGLPDNYVMSLCEDVRQRIWVSTRRGVAYFEDGRFVPVASVPGVNGNSIVEDSPGSIWINDRYLGLVHLLDERVAGQIPWTTFGPEYSANARLAADPSKGGLWVGFARGGVAFLRDGQVGVRYTSSQGLGEGSVNDLRVDANGTLWTATDGGLSRLKDGRIATLTKRNGLPCDTVYWSIEGDAQSLWLYMPCGLVRVARSELDAWIANPRHTIEPAVFDSSDGVRTFATPIGYSPRVTKSADGKLWFDSLLGVSVVDPRRLLFNKLPPPVHIEQIIADRKTYAAGAKLPLPALVRDLQIDYTALSLVAPEKNRFKYKLEGYDRDWQDVGNRRQAFYGNLSPRSYRFRVMASNNSGVWNEAGASFDFSIAAAYYQTRWFLAACTAAILALLWALYRFRLHQVAREYNVRVEERLGERTRIARDLHDTLLQSLAGVSLQLDGIAKQAATHPERTPSLIARVREQVDSAFREARTKVWDLRSTSLEVQELDGALRELVERIGPAMTARCSLAVTGHARPCTPEIQEELMRIAQEAANNANRHAQATEVRIALDYAAASLKLSISDNGRGFDFEEGYRKSDHWGLKNMQERAAQIRGKYKITTAVGQGTRIEVDVPLSSWSLRNTLAKHAHSSSGSR